MDDLARAEDRRTTMGGDQAASERLFLSEGASVSSICFMVATRRRPIMLERCLRSVAAEAGRAKGQHQIVVVENDGEARSSDVVSILAGESKDLKVHYLLEENIGIPFARNAALEFALGTGCALLAFIDDDEWLDPGWIDVMLDAAQRFEADVLTGPVWRELPGEEPLWPVARVSGAGATGERRKSAATNNTIIRADWFTGAGAGDRFDVSFRFTGGSDGEFFSRLVRKGARIVWVEEARVREEITPERLKLSYQLSQSRRLASNRVQFARVGRRELYVWPKFLFRGLRLSLWGAAVVAVGAITLIFARKAGRSTLVSGMRKLAAGIGTGMGLMRMYPQPYRSVSGR